MVVDCAQDVLKVHCYWPIVSDLINILPHRPIAYKFMADEKLLNFWFELVSYFQGKLLQETNPPHELGGDLLWFHFFTFTVDLVIFARFCFLQIS